MSTATMRFGVLDTEDDSRELMAAGDSGFKKTVTQIAALRDDGRKFHNRGNRDLFLSWLLEQKAQGVRTWYAHNVQYDLGNLFWDMLDQVGLVLVGGRVIRATWKGITFLDSFNLFPTSAEKLGEALGLKKLAFDAKSKKYVFRDCDIIRQAIFRLMETCEKYGVNKLPSTLGGLCVKLWQAMGGKNNPDWSQLAREAIYGGRVEIFSPGGRGNLAWTDINSLYPWAMTLPFPGPLRPCKTMMKYGITRCTVRVPAQWLAPLPYRVVEEDKLTGVMEAAIVFPCGEFTGTWTNHELFHAIKHHGVVITKIHETAGTNRAAKCYANFVLTFFAERLASSSEAFKLIYKLLMNNLYGQLGMGGTITRSVTATPELLQQLRDGTRDGQLFGEALLTDVTIPLPDHVNYCHAAHVTSYGRTRLLDHLRAVGRENLVYCDTDSCFFFAQPEAALPFKTGPELGDMKLEGFGRRIDVLAPKTYRLVTLKKTKAGRRWTWEAKAKGVPKKHALRFLRAGWVEYEAPFKIREAINFYDRKVMTETADGRPVYGEVPGGNARRLSVWRVVRKEFRSKYHKKRLKRDGRYHPLVLKGKNL